MQGIPVSMAIHNLARQLELNYIVDRRLEISGNWVGPDPILNLRWENLSAQEALQRILNEHKLKLITNNATSVARLVTAGTAVPSPPANEVAKDTSAPVPVLKANSEPLADVIRNIAQQARLNVSFDPDTTSVLKRGNFDVSISFRWQKITPRQALAALLDNYNLTMIEDAGSARIALKKTAQESDPGKRD